MASNPSKPKRPGTVGVSEERLLSVKDLCVLAKLPPAALAAWCLPERCWFGLCRHVAGLQPDGLDQQAQRLAAMLGSLGQAGTAREVARCHQAFIRLDQLCFLRSHRPGGWSPVLRLEGGQHLEAALEKGHGAILWVMPTVLQWLVTKRALFEAGYPVHHLSSPYHGFSTTSWLGAQLINPIRTRIEDRYLAERVMLGRDGSAQSALRRLTTVLRGNGIASIAVAASGARVIAAPFLGGSLLAARGAPHLATRTGAALLPVVTLGGDSGFVTRIEAPLACAGPDSPEARQVGAVAELARRLEPYARTHPDQIAWQLDCIVPTPPTVVGGETVH